MKFKRGFFRLLLLLSAVALSPPFVYGEIHEYGFDNGLKLLVKEDHRAPVVVSQVWYKVGSSYERDGITGISHALEHMMFNGTKKYPDSEFSRIISENGGRENAFTGKDYTAYFQILEKSRLAVSFELEADRMGNLVLAEEKFKKEIEVIREERRLRTEDNPVSYLYEAARATAFQTSPYRYPVVGWMADLEAMQLNDLKIWYQRWYAPNNATVVVVGDVEHEAVYQLAVKYFAPLKAGALTPPRAIPDVPQQGLKRINIKRPAEIPHLLMAYKAPALSSVDEGAGGIASRKPHALDEGAGDIASREPHALDEGAGDIASPEPHALDEGAGDIASPEPHALDEGAGDIAPAMSSADEGAGGIAAWEPYALEVLAGILDGGSSARLPANLVRGQEIATSVGVSYNLAGRLDDLFIIQAVPAKDKTIEEVEQGIREQLERLRDEQASDEEMSRVKAQVVSGDVYERDSLFYQAMALGIFETVGLPWQMAEEYVQRVQAVTAGQVRVVAGKYFKDDGLTIAVLKPQPIEREQERRQTGGGGHAM